MPRWTLATNEILDLLNREVIKPWIGSPWHSLKPGPKKAQGFLDTSDGPELREALLRIARPEIMQGVLQFPPEFSGVHWFYSLAGEAKLAAYSRDQNDHHVLAWPVLASELVQAMEASLALPAPAVVDGFALILNRGGCEALAAIVDLLQEEILKAVLDRRPPPELRFSIQDLQECLLRSSQSLDLRWMVQRFKHLAPTPLQNNIGDLEAGLKTLVNQQMLVQEDRIYLATPRFYVACSLLSGSSGLCALNTRKLVLKNGEPLAWERLHMGALRGIGSLWLFEFSDISADDFSVKLGDITSGLLHERLQAGIIPYVNKAAAPLPLKERPGEVKKMCLSCGAELGPAAVFCSACGRKVEPVQPPEPTRQVASKPVASVSPPGRCSQCGETLPPETKFCMHCGAPVTNSESSFQASVTAPPTSQSICQKCGATGQGGKKFCTQCGSPI